MMRTADILLLVAALIALVLSQYLWYQGQREESLFVGLWVPSILAFGNFLRSAIVRRR
jgi:hypothetical protein